MERQIEAVREALRRVEELEEVLKASACSASAGLCSRC
jgi:hypothetical protein